MSDFKLTNELKLTIPWKLALIFILFSTLIILMGIYYYKIQRNKDFKEQEKNLTAIATLKIREIVHWHNERIGDASTIKDNKPLIREIKQFFSDTNDPEIRRDITKWMQSVYKYYDYSGVLLVDTLLKVRLSVIPSDTVAGDAITDELHDVIRKNKIVMTDLHRATCISYVHLDLIIPLNLSGQKENKTFGFIILRIDPERMLFPLIKSWPTPSKSSETLLLRRQGDSILYLNDLRYQNNTALNLKMPLSDRNLLAARAGNGYEGVYEGTDYRNIPVVGYLSRIPDLPWYMVAKVDKEEIEEPLKYQIYISLLGTILLILINTSLFGFWIWDQQVRLYRNQLEGEASIRESEAKLRNSEELFSKLFHNMLNGFAYCKMLYQKDDLIDFIYINVNEAFESLTGLRNVNGKKVSEVIPGIQHADPELLTRYSRVALTGKPEVFETWVESLKMWFLISVYSPQKEYFVAVFDVITERKHREEEIRLLNEELEKKVVRRTEQFEAANKELEAFSYSVSHDLRAPLRAVHGYTNILMEEYEDKLDEEGKRLCRIISAGAIQMGGLIDDLLSFSRIGRSTLNPAVLDMTSMVKSGLDEVSDECRKNKITFTLSNLHKVKGDPGLIKLVWNNLISNAIKYSSKANNPLIKIGSVQENGSITYYVRDNGVGFDMQYEHKLFGVFQRLHTEREFEGNGVGLAIVQRIVLKHNGKVWAEGEVGKGATFYFSLPDQDNKQQAKSGSKHSIGIQQMTPVERQQETEELQQVTEDRQQVTEERQQVTEERQQLTEERQQITEERQLITEENHHATDEKQQATEERQLATAKSQLAKSKSKT